MIKEREGREGNRSKIKISFEYSLPPQPPPPAQCWGLSYALLENERKSSLNTLPSHGVGEHQNTRLLRVGPLSALYHQTRFYSPLFYHHSRVEDGQIWSFKRLQRILLKGESQMTVGLTAQFSKPLDQAALQEALFC